MSVRKFIRRMYFVLVLSCVACSSKQPAKESQPPSSSADQGKMAQVEPVKPQPPTQQQPAQQSAQQTPQHEKQKTITYATNPERFVKAQTYQPPFNITNPKTAQEHFNLGINDDNQKQFDKAIEEYQKALELKPDWALANFRLAKDYEKQGRTDEAIAQWKQATQSDSNYYEAYTMLAHAYKEKGETELAIQAYSKLLDFPPARMAVHYQLGIWYKELGDRQKARQQFETYRELALASKTNERESPRFQRGLQELQKLRKSP